LPFPIDADLIVVLIEGYLPKPAEHTSLLPALEVAMKTAAGAEFGWDGLPVTARAQHIENAVKDLAIGEWRSAPFARPSNAGQKGFDALPKSVGNAKVIVDSGARSGHEGPPVRKGRPAQALFALMQLSVKFWDRF
jgi:hypothetical protein